MENDILFRLVAKAGEDKTGTVIAGIALFAVMYILRKVPWITEKILTSPWRKRAVVVFMSVAPAVVSTLADKMSWKDAFMTAVATFLAATGVNAMMPSATVKALEKELAVVKASLPPPPVV